MATLKTLKAREKKLGERVSALIRLEGSTPPDSPKRPKILKRLKSASDKLQAAQLDVLSAEAEEREALRQERARRDGR